MFIHYAEETKAEERKEVMASEKSVLTSACFAVEKNERQEIIIRIPVQAWIFRPFSPLLKQR